MTVHTNLKDAVGPFVVLFRKDNDAVHLILRDDVDCDEATKISYDDSIYDLVRGETLEEMLVDGRHFDPDTKETIKARTDETIWDESWDEL